MEINTKLLDMLNIFIHKFVDYFKPYADLGILKILFCFFLVFLPHFIIIFSVHLFKYLRSKSNNNLHDDWE